MSTMTSYAKEILARIQGNESSIIAAQNERKSNAAVNGQIAALEALVVDQEEAVKDAEEALKEAKYPTTKISDNSAYIRGIRNAQERVTSATETLATTNESLTYFKGIKADFAKQVTAPTA